MSLSKEAVALLKNNAELVRDIMTGYMDSGKAWVNYIESETSPPVRFKDFHGNEVRVDDEFFGVDKSDFVMSKWICSNTEEGKLEWLVYFSTEQAAKDWIELNKPCGLSVNEIVEWVMDGNEDKDIINRNTSELLELIRKKEAK